MRTFRGTSMFDFCKLEDFSLLSATLFLLLLFYWGFEPLQMLVETEFDCVQGFHKKHDKKKWNRLHRMKMKNKTSQSWINKQFNVVRSNLLKFTNEINSNRFEELMVQINGRLCLLLKPYPQGLHIHPLSNPLKTPSLSLSHWLGSSQCSLVPSLVHGVPISNSKKRDGNSFSWVFIYSGISQIWSRMKWYVVCSSYDKWIWT